VSKSLVLTPASCVSILRKSPYGRRSTTSRRMSTVVSNVRCLEESVTLRARQDPWTVSLHRGRFLS
jgi:hypothetical protein